MPLKFFVFFFSLCTSLAQVCDVNHGWWRCYKYSPMHMILWSRTIHEMTIKFSNWISSTIWLRVEKIDNAWRMLSRMHCIIVARWRGVSGEKKLSPEPCPEIRTLAWNVSTMNTQFREIFSCSGLHCWNWNDRMSWWRDLRWTFARTYVTCQSNRAEMKNCGLVKWPSTSWYFCFSLFLYFCLIVYVVRFNGRRTSKNRLNAIWYARN